MSEFLKIAHLEEEAINEINQLEETLGVQVMAYQSGVNIANLDESQMDALKTLEDKLGVVLLAFAD